MAKEKPLREQGGLRDHRQPIYLSINVQYPEQVSFYRDVRALILCFVMMLVEVLKIIWLSYSPYLAKFRIRRKP